MATAKKHGNRYQVLVFEGYYFKDGVKKKKYKSISAKTKAEAEYKAAQYKHNSNVRRDPTDYTVRQAIEGYVNAKSKSLSPYTIAAYKSILRTSFLEIADVPLSRLTNKQLQSCVDGMDNSPKTVHNKYGLFTSAASYYTDYRWKVTLPMLKKPDLVIPTDNDLKRILSVCTNHDMKIAIYLAAFGPMRRGEIAALTYEDIDGNIISVNKSMVKVDGSWAVKTPKTKASYRKIIFPDFVISEIGNGEGRIVKMSPDRMGKNWERLRSKCELPSIRFHDLRHYGASILHAIGIPDEYILQRGGWETDNVMKSIYRGTLDDIAVKMNGKANDYFSETFFNGQAKIQAGIQKHR